MRLILCLSIFLLGISSCRKEATSWSSNWVVPIVNDTIDLKNLTNDSTLSVLNNFYQVELTRTLAKIRPEDYLDFPDTTIYKSFSIPLATLSIPPGTSFVTDNNDHIFDLDQVLLKKARVKSGKIILSVENPVNTISFFDIELPSATLNNVKLKKTISVPPKGKNMIEVDLSGYDLDLRGSTAISFNALPSKLKVYTDKNGPTVSMTNQDSTRLSIKLSDMKVDYAQGYFGQYEAKDNYSFDVPLFKENISGMIDLPNLSMEFIFSNGIKAIANANIKSAVNTNSTTGVTVPLISNELNKPFSIKNATGSWATLKASEQSLQFDQTNSNIENFIENLGNLTNVSYEMKLNPYGNITGGWDEFFPTSSLDIIGKLNMPLSIGLNDFKLKDTFDFNINQDLEKTHVESGILHLKIENAFPMQAKLKIYFLGVNNETISMFDQLKTIESSIYGINTSLGIPSTKSNIDIEFTPDLITKLDQIDKLYVVATFNTPNITTGISEIVSIPENAFLSLKAQTSFTVQQIIQK